MKILRHFTANDEQLERFDFRRELAMEAYLVENEGILALDEPFTDVGIVAEELTLKQGRTSQNTDGRIDLLITYGQEYIGVVELKLGQLKEIHLKQLEDYLEQKDEIPNQFKDIFSDEVTTDPSWIGVLVGNSIDDELASKISAGYKTDPGGIPIAALTLQRFRSDKGNVYVVTESYFKDTKPAKDKTSYEFDGQVFGKGRLVLAVMKNFISKNPETTIAQLEEAFPKSCQGSRGVFNTLEDANKEYMSTNRKRHFLNEEEIIVLKDGKIAVSNQWGIKNIDKFIKQAGEHDLAIEERKTPPKS